MIELNPGYIEQANHVVEKVDMGQKLCNCAKSQFYGGQPTGGKYKTEM